MIQVEERKSTAHDPYKALGLAIIEAAATVYKDALVKHDDVALSLIHISEPTRRS